MSSISHFLSYAKRGLRTAIERKNRVTIVVGNESADLDSLTSSILYAYFRSLDPPRQAFSSLYIPLLNIPKADLRIRPEFTALFRHANIDAENLVTLNDLPPLERIKKVLEPANTRWILVDHNRLQGALGTIYYSRVRGVIDHHNDQNSVPPDTDPEPRVIEKCGSCTSLVIRTFKSTWDAMSAPVIPSSPVEAQDSDAHDNAIVTKSWDAQIAKLALASILVDTVYMTAEDVVEAADREAAQHLNVTIRSFPGNGWEWDQKKFYEEINDAKTNLEGFEFDEILRKDYKEWTYDGTKFGISSVAKPLEFVSGKARQSSTSPTPSAITDAFDQAIETFMQSKSLSIFAIMTIFQSPGQPLRRELFLQATNTSSAAAISRRFAETASETLGLDPVHVPGIGAGENGDDGSSADGDKELGMTRKVWSQEKTWESRKQVAPLLSAAIKDMNSLLASPPLPTLKEKSSTSLKTSR